MANVMVAAGVNPYLQFGEVQWWYFPDDGSGMPFYDAYTMDTFEAEFGRPLTVITSNTFDPATIPDEVAFLPGLIGAFTSQIRAFVRAAVSDCRFEVLYPPDVNNTPLNKLINYPAGRLDASESGLPENGELHLHHLQPESGFKRYIHRLRRHARFSSPRSAATW